MDIGEWLRSLGLDQYETVFRHNAVDVSVLPDLTDQDLEKLGVLLGHRRKLLRAIPALDGSSIAVAPAIASPTTAPSIPPGLASAALAPISAPEAAAGERRYLTVMFCDLVGSTAMSAQLDAEEWRDLVGAYLDDASAAVREMGGHVAKKLGDGLMALFGYPLAHENDAERAVRAALAIQRALPELNRRKVGTGKPELKARIGLETGLAVLDAAGEIYGDVANVAARVQVLAEPGAVLVTARVQRQVAGLFVAEERGTHTLQGIPEPTALFRLMRASGGGRRSGARQLTPLAGRDDEITMLTRRWERARQGDGQLVLIVGEPGLGKSRLIEEFHARLSEVPHTWVEWSCSQLLQNTPLHPIAEWGRLRFGGADVPAEGRFADLENSLTQVKLDPVENAALLAPLLDIPLSAERAMALAPEELRRRQLAALTNWVIAGARVQPVVLALEDLHWADPTTLDLLRGVAERGALAPLFVLITARPEFRAPWSTRSHHSTISLSPLDRQHVWHMVSELAARHALPRDVIEGVTERTAGVPLFVEEVTRLLLERGEQGGIQAIPPTLQQSLTARLDRLGPAREVAQIGAVIGRGFSYPLLRAIAGMADAPLQAALERLAEADILLVQGLPPDSDYRFKHTLMQDAAYENLLKSRRQVLHRRVAEALRDSAGTAAVEPELLAHHFAQAGLIEAAFEWWSKAGQRSLERSSNLEAAAFFGNALDALGKLPADRRTRELAIDLRFDLRTALMPLGEFARTLDALREAEAVAKEINDARRLGKVVASMTNLFWEMGDQERAITSGRRALEIAAGVEDGALRDMALRYLGCSYYAIGDYKGAIDVFKQAMGPRGGAAAASGSAPRPAVDRTTVTRVFLMLCLAEVGEFAEAIMCGEESLRIAQAIDNPFNLCAAQSALGRVHLHRGDFGEAGPLLEKAFEICKVANIPLLFPFVASPLGACYIGLGRLEEALPLLEQAVDHASAMRRMVEYSQWTFWLSQALLLDGNLDRAVEVAERALEFALKYQERGHQAWTLRLLGDICVERGDGAFEQAESYYKQSMALARELGMRPLQARCHLAHGILHGLVGHRDEARTAFSASIELARAMEMRFWSERVEIALKELDSATRPFREGNVWNPTRRVPGGSEMSSTG
jgi:class 3 adenylate cyclase/tetratricopeptide (TPR) repeat protein